MEGTCNRCIHSEWSEPGHSGDVVGRCRRYPPDPHHIGHPRVSKLHWCGEYEFDSDPNRIPKAIRDAS